MQQQADGVFLGFYASASVAARLQRGAQRIAAAWAAHVERGDPYPQDWAALLQTWDKVELDWRRAGGKGCLVGGCAPTGLPVCLSCAEARRATYQLEKVIREDQPPEKPAKKGRIAHD